MAEEKIYHAVVKKYEGDVPSRVVFTATNPGTAIAQLNKLMKVESSAGIYEFEILEVVGRDKYKLAARKNGIKQKPRIMLDTTKLEDEAPWDEEEEESYNAYTVEAA